jgi:hypothetical protein
MESNDLLIYTNTFVLYPTLNKWGLFSERVQGILPLTNDLWGYVDAQGYCHYFVNTINRGADPAVELGRTRAYPRIQKIQLFPSSSGVGIAYPMDATEITDVPVIAGWYDSEAHGPVSEGTTGLNSHVYIGYFRPSDLTNSIQANVEIQTMVFGSTESRSPETEDTMTELTNWKPEWFYTTEEDWNDAGTAEDWNLDAPSEDWNWSGSLRPRVSHNIEIHTSEEGITFDIRELTLSRFYTGAWKYASMTLGVMNVIHVSAEDVDQYWHFKYLELQMQYGGESA